MSTINPTISIIVPVYNVEKYLPRCIDSILNQTFSDFELILVDDGSPDRCGHICDEYAAKDERIRVIHKRNGGVSSARNAALDIVQGEYVMFCDGDDAAEPLWCEKMYSLICQYSNYWIICNVWRVDSQGKQTTMHPLEKQKSELMCVPFYSLYCSGLCGSLWSTIFSAKRVRENGLRFNEKYKIGEDTDFTMRYLKHCNGILFLSEPLYFYHQNIGSAVHSYRYNNFDLYRHCFTDRLPFVEPEYLDNYLDNWIYRFLQMLDEVFDSRNPMSFWNKMQYCQKMMQTEEFRYCVSHAPGKDESPAFMKVVRKHNFYLFWIFQKLCKIKAHLRR